MKTLFVAPFYLPAFKAGGPVKSISNIVNVFSFASESKPYILTRDRDIGDIKCFDNISLNKWLLFKDNCFVFYLSHSIFTPFSIYKCIKNLNPSVIYLNSFFDFYFSIYILLLNRFGLLGDVKVLLAPRGEISDGALSIGRFKKMFVIKLLFKLGLYGSVKYHVTSVDEQNDLIRILNIKKIDIFLASNIPSLPLSINKSEIVDKVGVYKLIFLSRI